MQIKHNPILYTYHNRHNDKLIFSKVLSTITVTGYDDQYLRCGYEDNINNINRVDPSGGPYLCIDMDLGDIIPKLKGITIKQIFINKKHLIIHTNE